MTNILIPVIIVACIGCIAGIILTIASRFMQVPVDETVAAIKNVLPGANCGACGFAGCDDYAQALGNDPDLSTSLCPVGGAQTAVWIADILCKTADSSVQRVAVVRCLGSNRTTNNIMHINRLKSCRAAKTLFGGQKSCQYGCLGMGDCAKVCDYDAIQVVDGLASVDRSLCVGCGKCKAVCPNDVIEILDKDDKVYVSCVSIAKGAITKQTCSSGCLGCQKCKKECPQDAIIIEHNLARIDYDKCVHCGVCADVCPADVIVNTKRKIKVKPQVNSDGFVKM